mgnify:CR=1 FL=1
MRTRTTTMLVIVMSLVAGACAARFQSPPTPAAAQEHMEPVDDVVKLRIRPLSFSELLLPSIAQAVDTEDAREPQRAGCDIPAKIDESRSLLEPITLNVGSNEYRYTEARAGRTLMFKDPEKDIALALMNLETCELRTVVVTKRGDTLITPREYDIDVVRRANGIRWNNWATEFVINRPEGFAVIANSYPYIKVTTTKTTTKNKAGKKVTTTKTEKTTVPVFYTGYTKDLHTPELVLGGRAYLEQLAQRAYDELRRLNVQSLASPGARVADVSSLKPSYLARLAPNEHMDMTEFILDPLWTAERIQVVIAANRDRVASYTCSPASACGLMQFTAGTYVMMQRLYPAALLTGDFVNGARDPFNAMKAAVLLHDYNLSQLTGTFGESITSDPRLEEYLAAAYNTGIGRVIKIVRIAKKNKSPDWAEVRGSRSGERLLAETKGYIAKLRFLKDHWEPALADARSGNE